MKNNQYRLYQTTLKLKEMIKNQNSALAKAETLKLIEKYPDEYILKNLLAQIYMYEKEYEKALELLESLNYNYVFKVLISLYIKLGREEDLDKLYDIYLQYYASNVFPEKSDEYTVKLYLSKLFGKLTLLETQNLTYKQKLICEYDEKRVLDFIKQRHFACSDRKKFFENIDLIQLFYQIKDYIKNNPNKGVLVNELTEEYCFYYPGCGSSKECLNYDYIRVATFINRAEIITMFPSTRMRNNPDICYLEKEKSDSNNIVRARNGLERFRSKYGNQLKQ